VNSLLTDFQNEKKNELAELVVTNTELPNSK
jgi:hypothetical protein